MEFCGDRAFQLLKAQTDLGIRAPGTPGQAALLRLIREQLREVAPLQPVVEQAWPIRLSHAPAGPITLTNLLLRIPGHSRDRTTLIGTHHDTRWIADREPDEALRSQPILGANDGGSGTAIQLELARILTVHPPKHDVVLAFFDGEDLGDLDGFSFATGSAHFVHRLTEPAWSAWCPDEMIGLDMVGGVDMHLNLERNSLAGSAAGRRLFTRLFQLGRAQGHPAFFHNQERWIISDHGPFLEAGIPAVLLIDIDYPWWHTQGDRPEHCSAESLAAVGQVLEAYLRGTTP